MNKVPQNQEHFEAHQEEMNQKKEELKETLPVVAQTQMEVVESCVRQLTEAKIPFYLFPETQGEQGYKVMWQFNSLGELSEYDNSGKITEECQNRNAQYNFALLRQIFYIFMRDVDFSKSFEEDAYKYIGFIQQVIPYLYNNKIKTMEEM